MSGTIDVQLPLEGGCHCGALRFRVSEAPALSMACHCTACQQFSASAFSLGLVVPSSGVDSIKGEARTVSRTADSGNTSRQFFCGDCGGWVATHIDEKAEVTVVRAMQLDDHSWFRPVGQVFTRSALPWAVMPIAASWETEWEDAGEIEALKTIFSQIYRFGS